MMNTNKSLKVKIFCWMLSIVLFVPFSISNWGTETAKAAQEEKLTSSVLRSLTSDQTITLDQDYYMGIDIFLQDGNEKHILDLNGHSLRIPADSWLNVKEAGQIKNGTLILDKGTVNLENSSPVSRDVKVTMRNGTLNAARYTFSDQNLEIQNGIFHDASLDKILICGKAEIDMSPDWTTQTYSLPVIYNKDIKYPIGEELYLSNAWINILSRMTVPNGKKLIVNTGDMYIKAQGKLCIEEGGILQILEKSVLSVDKEGVIENKGEITNAGEIRNSGSIIDLGSIQGNEVQGNTVKREQQLTVTGGTASFENGSPGTELKVLAGQKVTVKADAVNNGKFLKWTSDAQVEFENETSAVTTFVMPDTKVTITAVIGPDDKPAGKKVSKVTLNAADKTIQKGKTYQLKAAVLPSDAKNKKIVWKSSNAKVAAVDSKGKVTAVNYGRAVITASAADGSGKSSSCRIKVPYQIKYKLNKGKNNKKNPAFYYQQEIALRNPSRRGYLFKGWYQKKNFKKKIKKITKSSKKNYTLYAKWEKVKVKASSLKKLRNKQSGKITLSFTKVKGAKGYQIKYASNKKYKKAKYKSAKKRTVVLKGLKKGKRYYFKVRAYKLDSAGKKVYSKYSRQMVWTVR